MGPHSFEQGNEGQGRDNQVVEKASMGPHSFEQGNEGDTGRRGAEDTGFNGASLIRARKHAAKMAPKTP